MIDENASIAEAVATAIRSVTGTEPAPLHEPYFGPKESQYVQECLTSTFVSSVGPFVNRFEQMLCEFTGSKYAIATVNGTTALQLALLVSGVQPGDEVFIPALTFVATANAVAHCGAIPHLIDSEDQTLGIDPQKLLRHLIQISEKRGKDWVNKNTGRIIRAIVPMHAFGHPSKIEEICSIADQFGIDVIEDSAESLGSYFKGKHTGTFGRLGILSFNGNKTITTGGGGAILTNDESIAKTAKHLSTTAKIAHKWAFDHDAVGFNYRLPNINAALGCAQLENLPKILKAKRQLFELYQKAFASVPSVTLLQEPSESRSNYWLQTILLNKASSQLKEKILETCNDRGLMARPAWSTMDRLKPYFKTPRDDLSNAHSLFDRIINIPSSPKLVLEKTDENL